MHPRLPISLPLLVLALLFLAGCSSYPHQTPEEFGASFFKAVQQNDRQALNRFLPTQDDVFASLERSGMKDKKKDKVLKTLTRDWPRRQKKMATTLDKAWEALFSEANDADIDLGEAVFLRAEAKTRNKNGLSEGDIDVLLDHGGTTYRIRIHDASQVPRGWLLGKDAFEWKGENRGR